MTKNELQQIVDALKTSIESGIKDGFNNQMPRAFDINGNALPKPNSSSTRDEWNAFLKAVAEQKRNEHEAEIIRQIEAIKSGNQANSSLARKKIDELKNELERSQNGGISKKDTLTHFYKKAGMAVNYIFKIIESGIDLYVASGQQELAYRRAGFEKEIAFARLNLKRQTAIISNGMKGITDSFTKNSLEMSRDFVNSSYDLAKLSVDTSMGFDIASKNYTKAIATADKDFIKAGVTAGGAIIGASIGLAVGGPLGLLIGGFIGSLSGLVATSIDKIMGLDIQRKEFDIEINKQVKEFLEQEMETFKTIVAPWDNLYHETAKFVLTVKNAGQHFSRTIGYGGTNFSKTMFNMATQTLASGTTLAKTFGKEAEKIPQYMETFMSESQRNVNLSANDIGNIMATSYLFGMNGNESASLYGSMNIFNTSVSSASDSMGVMYHQITRMGLSTKKFGKDLVNNLKLAQKYNFKGGVDNMMKLTKWAQQTRFNLNSAASFADSILDGSLSDALEKSARLQVLGGAAAIYSDPLGMLYDAGANVGDLARRQAAMFSDLTGTFNSKTGETDFSWYENKMIRERAKAAGLNVEDVFNQIRQTNKQGVIDKLLGGMDEEDRIAIGNRATYNKKKGRWEVTDIKGNVHDIQEYKNNEAKIEDLLPKDTQESILKVVSSQLSVQENIENIVSNRMFTLGKLKQGDIEKTELDKAQKLNNAYLQNLNKTSELFDKARQYSMDVLNLEIKMMETSINQTGLFDNIHGLMLKRMGELIDNITAEGLEGLSARAAYQNSNDSKAVTIQTKGFMDPTSLTPEERAYLISPSVMRGGMYLPSALKEQMKKIYIANGMSEAEAEAEIKKYEANQNKQLSNEAVRNNPQIQQEIKKLYSDDGIGYTNGGIITGASNVKSINDGAVNVKTARSDQYLVAKTGGPIDILLKQILPGLQALLSGNGGSNNVNLNLNGKLELSQDGSSVNLVELIKNDPAMATKFLAVLQKTMEVNQNGKSVTNHKIS